MRVIQICGCERFGNGYAADGFVDAGMGLQKESEGGVPVPLLNATNCVLC